MAATVQLPFSPKRIQKTTVVYLVRSSRAYARIRSLTTGTFNRVVKDRSTVRLSGAHSVQANSIYCELLIGQTHRNESDCPRNLTNIRCGAKPCQPMHPTGFPDDFHIGKTCGAGLGSFQPTADSSPGFQPCSE